MRRFAFIIFLLFVSFPALGQDAKPALWQVGDDDTTIYLFGTIHALKPGTVWMDDDLASIILGVDRIFLEISPAETQNAPAATALVRQYGLLPEGDSLVAHLPEKTATQLKDELASLGIPEEEVERFKPWLAGTTYSIARFIKLGYNPATGVEAMITDLAQARNIPLDGLESLEFQVSMFNSMSDEETMLFIEDLLMEQEELEAKLEEITVSWTNGDARALDKAINDLAEKSPSLAEKLLYSRNRTWVQAISDLLAEPGQFLIAVGAGHFVGENSVIALLPKAGIAVQRLQ